MLCLFNYLYKRLGKKPGKDYGESVPSFPSFRANAIIDHENIMGFQDVT